MTSDELFYDNQVFTEEVAFARVVDTEPLEDRSILSVCKATLTAFAVAAVLTVTVPSFTHSIDPAPRKGIVSLLGGSTFVSPARARRGSLVRQYLAAVPLSPVELLPDPDYGL